MTLSVAAGTTKVMCSHSGCDTLPEPTQPPSLPQEEDVLYGKILSGSELAKLQELTALDSLNEDPDYRWGEVRVLEHRTRRIVERIPKHYSAGALSEGSKIRLKVQFHNGFLQWVNMDAIKVGDPVPAIVYASSKSLTKSPGWLWTTAFSKDEVDQLSTAYATKAELAPKYKFGVQVPKTIKQALQFDKINGNHLWAESIQKEMYQLSEYQTFRLPLPDEDLSVYQRIPCHMVYDVKFDGMRKSRLVARGNKAIVPDEEVYSGVVGIESIRLILALTAAGDYKMCATDIGNAFLYGKTRRKQ